METDSTGGRSPAGHINGLLDSLPRGQVLRGSSAVPAYRACGVVGFYAALLLTFAGGFVTGRSLLVLGAVAVVCAGAFFAYTYLRMWIAGFECLVLIEHVWFALAATAAALYLMGEPLLPYLDTATPGLCLFLASGRAGCLVAGCCHGCPASIGIRYPKEMAADGFPPHWADVRLLPVQAIEGLALAAIGLTGWAAAPWAAPGQVLAWYLLAYSIVRFGVEGLRGDRRPHWLGLSQARWMALIETGAVIWWQHAATPQPNAPFIAAIGLVGLGCWLVHFNTRSLRARMLHDRHLAEIRDVVEALQPGPSPAIAATTRGLALAVSSSGHISMSLPGIRRDLRLLCDVAAAAFPGLRVATAQYLNGVLHVVVDRHVTAIPTRPEVRAESLWAHAAGRAQQTAVARVAVTPAEPPINAAPAPASSAGPWYYRAGASG